MLGGKRRDMGLGAVHTVTLAEAREEARQCRLLRRDGVDPIERRRAAKLAVMADAAKAMTFKECAEAFIKSHEAGWQNAKHAAQWTSTLTTYAYPVMGSLPVNAVDTGLVMKIIEPIWTTKTETASRVRGRIESILDWATVRKYRVGENPARWKGHLDHLFGLGARDQDPLVDVELERAELPSPEHVLQRFARRDRRTGLLRHRRSSDQGL